MATAYKSASSAAVGTVNTLIYTAPALTTSLVTSLVCANIVGGSATIKVTVTNVTTAVTTNLAFDTSIASAASLAVITKDKIVTLNAGDTIHVISNTATSIDVTASIIELS